MSMEQSESSRSYLWLLAVGLGLYCIVLTAFTGDIGFTGDDWWVLAVPYWNSFPHAIARYAREFSRPVEGLYWITLFKLFGFERAAFHLCSLLLLAGSAVLMGVALDKAFPRRQTFVSIAVLLAFFLPPVSCLTYVVFTDNSRLTTLLFWTSVIAFQRWAQKSSSWRGLALPIALYVVSFLTYEGPSFLIFLTPLLVLPVYRRYSDQSSDRAFLVKLCVGILSAFTLAVAIRLVVLSGGAVARTDLLSSLELVWSYLALLPFYLMAPFTSMSADRWALLAGALIVLWTAGLFLFSSRSHVEKVAAEGRFGPGSQWYPVALGVGILMLGMLPYQLAGYGSSTPNMFETVMVKCRLLPEGDLSWYNFTWASRIYSSASFGVAILLACLLSGWRQAVAKSIGKIVALVLIGFMAVFHAGLSQDWREAAAIRNDLLRSLISRVPAVKSGTNFVFLDLACTHKRAEVIRRENGLAELIQMLYGDRTLGAWRLYPYAYDRLSHVNQQSVATPEGFLCGDSQRQREPSPHNSLLLFKRSGRELVLLDKITAQDGLVPTGIEWRGVQQLATNFERIEPWSLPVSSETRIAGNVPDLITSLGHKGIKSTPASVRGRKYVLRNELRRRLFNVSPHLFGPHL